MRLMTHEPGSARARLSDAVQDAWRAYCALEATVPYPERQHNEPICRSKISASSPAWHSEAAGLVLELHRSTRVTEDELRKAITGRTPAPRGASVLNTKYSLLSIPPLASFLGDGEVSRQLLYIDMWVRRADTVFSPELAIHRMPRNPGEAEHRCPWCTYQTMRWRPVKGIAFCVNPSCRNDDGRRPQWIVEYSVVDDHMEFFWRELMTEAA